LGRAVADRLVDAGTRIQIASAPAGVPSSARKTEFVAALGRIPGRIGRSP
jgi:hypothetical protein